MDDKFFFGVSTAAHQIEGNNFNNWSEWEKVNAHRLALLAQGKPQLIEAHPAAGDAQNYISGNACNSYELFNEDIKLVESLGCNAYRFSIEWSRIEPEEGKFNLSAILKYREMILAMKTAGIEPFITLHHFTIPVWLEKKGGIIFKGFPEYFARFVERIGSEFRTEVKYICTINEPEILSLNSYYRGLWPPAAKNFLKFRRARKNLIKAHIFAFRKLKNISSDFVIGSVCNLSYFETAGGFSNSALTMLAKSYWNFYFLDRVKKYSDFIGINYYFHNRISGGLNKNENKATSDLGWELYPQGIEKVLVETYSRYKLPIFITENGLADASDKKRPLFIEETFRAMFKAKAEGVDLRGYFHWSLIDNFEWDKGFWPKFGLFKVDFATFERTPRASAKVYTDKIKKYLND